MKKTYQLLVRVDVEGDERMDNLATLAVLQTVEYVLESALGQYVEGLNEDDSLKGMRCPRVINISRYHGPHAPSTSFKDRSR